MAGEIGRWQGGEEYDSGMGGFSRKARTDDEGGPGRIFIEKGTQGFQQKGEVLLVRVPPPYGDNLILFGDGRVKLKDIGLNGVRNAVDFGRVDPEAVGEGFPEIGGMRSFYRYRGQEF